MKEKTFALLTFYTPTVIGKYSMDNVGQLFRKEVCAC